MLAPFSRESKSKPRRFRTSVGFAGRVERRPWRVPLICVLLLSAACALSGSLRADDEDDEDDEAPPARHVSANKASDDSPLSAAAASKPSTGQTDDGPGVDFRGGISYGQGPVQDRSILPIEMFPFFMSGDSLFFSDMRFYPTIDGTFGGSLGAGCRYYSPRLDRIFGASLWYDADGTRDQYFQQIGLSLESYGTWLDFRTNFYLPVGQTTQQSSSELVTGSPRFVGESLVYDQLNNYLAAMRGLDMEVGVQLPGSFAKEHGIRLYGGWYYYGDEQGDHILGASARLQANIASGLDASVQVTNDNYFDTRAILGVSWTCGEMHMSNLAQDNAKGRMG